MSMNNTMQPHINSPQGTAAFVVNLAKKHGISYVRTENDVLADAITHLSDDEVVMDDIENLMVALRRANVINGRTLVSLLGCYIDEKKTI